MKFKETLFPLPEANESPSKNNYCGKPRLVQACRNQGLMQLGSLDEIIPEDHLVRDVWGYVDSLNLSIMLSKIKSCENRAGRPATDPKILLALWLFGTVKSIGSSRVLEEYSREHDAFKWICGGVRVNYHTISDFRTAHGDQLHELLTSSVVALSQAGIISLEKVSQDGVRVRASAGSSSFRRETSLRDQLQLAQYLVDDLREEEKNNPGACRSRIVSSRKRAAEERVARINLAVETIETRRSEKPKNKSSEKEQEKIRGSKTDHEARVMKMACGGFRPAYNVQFASTNKGKAIIGVHVTNAGTDSNQIYNMMKQVDLRYKAPVLKWFADKGYAGEEDLNKVTSEFGACNVYMPIKTEKDSIEDPYTRRVNESKAMGDLRERMGTKEAKILYRERAETAELVNAQARNRGLQQFEVRGVKKVECVALMFALTHNMLLSFGYEGFSSIFQ